jgi:hypothetical protein
MARECDIISDHAAPFGDMMADCENLSHPVAIGELPRIDATSRSGNMSVDVRPGRGRPKSSTSSLLPQVFDSIFHLKLRPQDGMRWFRDHIRHGSWFALLALTINLALSFGHFHTTDGKVVQGGLFSTLASAAAPDEGSKPGHPSEGHVDVLCPICVAASAMAHALAATPPVLPVVFASIALTQTLPPVVALVEPQRAPFQSRGPPLS